jgi:tetratricopeptide (TPR) repeat protein
MQKEHGRLVIATALAVGMAIGISNTYGSAFADPAHCDRPGWPSCYKVGYEDGLGRSGTCLTGHSSNFCRGWNDANVESLTNKGITLDNLGNYSGAMIYYNKALAINSHDVRALTNKGIALDKLGNYTGAISYYNKALTNDTENTAALTNKGIALDKLGNYTGAISYYNKALVIDPNLVTALTNKDKTLELLNSTRS